MQAHRFENLKNGDFVDINPLLAHPGWKCGEIRRLDGKSGQVLVAYAHEEKERKTHRYWAHLDDTAEIAEFSTWSALPLYDGDDENDDDKQPGVASPNGLVEDMDLYDFMDENEDEDDKEKNWIPPV